MNRVLRICTYLILIADHEGSTPPARSTYIKTFTMLFSPRNTQPEEPTSASHAVHWKGPPAIIEVFKLSNNKALHKVLYLSILIFVMNKTQQLTNKVGSSIQLPRDIAEPIAPKRRNRPSHLHTSIDHANVPSSDQWFKASMTTYASKSNDSNMQVLQGSSQHAGSNAEGTARTINPECGGTNREVPR